MFSILSIAIFIMAVYLMNRTFIGFQPGTNKINSDVGKFRSLASKWKPELVPWNSEETELFSLNESNKVGRKGFGRSAEAIIQSIYHEPLLYYYYKEYPATKRNAVLLAQTARYEIVYRIRSKGTQVFVNEDFVGTIGSDGNLYRESERKLLGSVESKTPSHHSVIVQGREVGTMYFPQEKTNVPTRVFDMDEKLADDQHLLFMVQVIYVVVRYLVQK